MNVYQKIEFITRVQLRPGSPEEVQKLRNLGMPEEACAFFRNFEPSRCAEIAKVRLYAVDDVLVENPDAVPDCDVPPLGYVVFATTDRGDAYCFDTGTEQNGGPSKVVLISHELNWEGKTREEVLRLAKLVADCFERLLERLSARNWAPSRYIPNLRADR